MGYEGLGARSATPTPELRKTMFDAYMNAADAIAMLISEGIEKTRQFVSKCNSWKTLNFSFDSGNRREYAGIVRQIKLPV